jgi:carboxyl-terminal processing protease
VDLFDPHGSHPEGPEHFMKRYFKPILVMVALSIALVLTITRRHGIDVDPATAAQRDDKRPYDLAALRIFNSTLMRVNDAYVDPTRVDPKQMLLAALDQVQKSVAEVLVEPHPEQGKVKVSVDTATQEFLISEVDSPWALSMKMREVFRFISQNLPPGTDSETVRNIEYAATNGMLSTLDPHSMLLDPQMYNEMKLNTRGSFGGLGIVIGIRKGSLTVIKPMPDTPAWKAGVKAGDRIVRIEKESTVNMMLNDAVARLRGDPDTKVELWIEKAGEKNAVPKKVVLTRAVIQVKTVEAHMLKNNVGYVKLYNSFGGNTAEELRRAMDELKQKGMKALVFDLRSNPGGLLDQAIKVADEFVDTGTIVTTVGYANKQREEKRATPGNQPHIPMACLVNHGSASASEIVAGALKNLDRAVVIGTRTFGKGSVQVLYDNDDGSALKLTIAQYLTPGDESIQSVGITPDVVLDKVAIDKDKGIWLFRDFKGMTEADLESHLTSKNTRVAGKPYETLKFLAPEPPKKQAKSLLRDDEKTDDGEADPDAEPDDDIAAEDTFVEDYEIQFARDLVSQAKGWKRREVLASSKSFFEKKDVEEALHLTDALKKLGVDWTPVGAGQAPQLTAVVTTDKASGEMSAGDTVHFTAKVTNKGPGTAGQVRAQLQSDDPLFEGREFVFGRIKPGESRTFTVPVRVPKDALSRVDPLKLALFEEHAPKAVSETDGLTIKVRGLARPVFAYTYQIIDDIAGNGDGLVQRGESVRLHVTVKNTGTGKSNETLAQLRNLSDEGLYINKGRFNVDNLQPGEQKSVDFTFDLKPEYQQSSFKVELTVYDSVLHEMVTDKLSFPVATTQQPVEAVKGAVSVSDAKALLLSAPSKDATVIGSAERGALFRLTGVVNGYWRVEATPGQPGYLIQNAAQRSDAAAPTVSPFTAAWMVAPPRLALKDGPALTDLPTYHLSGTAHDEKKLSDVFVFVSNRTAKIDHRKVFYRSNRKGATPLDLGFDADIPLWPGANIVTVVARQNSQVQSQQTLVIERQGPRTGVASAKSALPEDVPTEQTNR